MTEKKIIREETKTYTEKKEHILIRCDICCKEAKIEHPVDDTLIKFRAEKGEVGFYWEDIEVYPECRIGKVILFHICHDCFHTKLIPLMKERYGAEPTKREINDSW